ncbi:hypothetical protein [Streptomyces sp. NBC_00503]|uniref:hypothetical protein n=1 Tax=Streptomyces sp. NBC_00503 TaxID=2903659 RepID=UPI002E821F5D|nr:hypothetical protein [Streptomyces sp. NBC_00503]WUD85675.1 hypothetical protein OG490_36825 [Streptomyces sp. NBC_00503]
MMVTLWPPTNRDGAALIRAYEDLLSWPLIVGTEIVSAGRALQLMGEREHMLHTTCSAFDAVFVPAALGSDVLVLADRRDAALAPIPALTYGNGEKVLLVEPETARPLTAVVDVRVESGPGGRIALPPSRGARWDTWPWELAEPKPVPLTNGVRLLPVLRTALANTPTG